MVEEARIEAVAPYFQELGDAVERRWRERNHDERALPAIAEQQLREMPAAERFGAADVLRHVRAAERLPSQLDYPGQFGEPPVTIWRSSRLVIDVYYWFDGTTSIHQHSFSGAFQLLSGSSLHAEYRFAVRERISSRLSVGDLTLVGTELLEVGHTRRIESGPRFIHSLFHLDRPSATIVVRTPDDPDAFPQLFYRKPHLAMDSAEDVLATRRVEALRALRETDRAGYERELQRLARCSELAALIPPLLDYARFESDQARIDEKLALARGAVGEHADLLRPVLREVRRKAAIVDLRRQVHGHEHRFFLALLLNVADGREIATLVQRRYPDQAPHELIARWTAELSGTGLERLGDMFNEEPVPNEPRASGPLSPVHRGEGHGEGFRQPVGAPLTLTRSPAGGGEGLGAGRAGLTGAAGLDYFGKLGADVERRWRDRHYDEHALPDIALEEMRAAPAPEAVDARQVLLALQRLPGLPQQLDPAGKFGEPPITFYRSTRLAVDLYYWLDGTTTVHQHSFSGAFQLLHGASIHAQYRFAASERINAQLALGALQPAGAELLGPGDTRRIVSGASFIHSLFHLDRPSATVVVRTLNDADAPPQFNYYRPHLAMDARADPLTTRKIQVLGALRQLDPRLFDGEMAALAATADLATLIPVLVEYAKIETSVARIDELLERARPRLGERASLLAPVLRETHRQVAIIRRRHHAHRPDHRFLLALLLNVPSRGQIIDLIERRYPGASATEWIIDAIQGMAAERSASGGGASNALGIAFGEDTMPVLAGLLRGRAAAAIAEEMSGAGFDPDGLESQIARFHGELRGSLLFRALFAAPSS